MWRRLRSAEPKRRGWRWWGISLLLLTCHLPAVATDDGLLISGMLLDRTITRHGKEFSDIYSAYWRELPATEGVTVVILEQIYPQAGTLLTVQLEQRRIYQTYLGRRLQEIRPLAEQAVMGTLQELARLQAERMLGTETTLEAAISLN